jgi:hypothetical protein
VGDFASAVVFSLAGGMTFAVLRIEIGRALQPNSAVRQLWRMMRDD